MRHCKLISSCVFSIVAAYIVMYAANPALAANLAAELATPSASKTTFNVSAAQQKSLGLAFASPVGAASAKTAGASNQAWLEDVPAQVMVPTHLLRVISAPLAGLIEEVKVVPGQTVHAGQVLARVRSPQAAEIQRGLSEARVGAQLAQENLNRDQQLYAEGLIAESRLRQTRALSLQANAQLQERQQAQQFAGLGSAKLEGAKNSIDGAILMTAPFAATVLDVQAVLGSRVEAATALFKLAQPGPLWLEMQVPFAQLAAVQSGAPVEVTSAQGVITGKVMQVGAALQGDSQTVLVRAELTLSTNPKNQAAGGARLTPGQFIRARIAMKNNEGANTRWQVPLAALVQTNQQSHLFVRGAGDEMHMLTVEVQQRDAQHAWVNSAALRADSLVVVKGASTLKGIFLGLGKE